MWPARPLLSPAIPCPIIDLPPFRHLEFGRVTRAVDLQCCVVLCCLQVVVCLTVAVIEADRTVASRPPVVRVQQLRFMSDLEPQIPGAFDPFAEANADDSGAGSKDYVHVRVQQRNGRKSLTTVQGLKKEFNYNKILKDFKKEFCCNGTVVQDPELGQVIQLQGDQRKNVSQFLVSAGVVKKDLIKIHGF
ncbi:hypothetical protein R1flu_003614 [Riccia fluitans]|uniref:SUI1 domain-containing protein n=1 Tax=Riccia fluitans TaxID=41844 RepID=A0ABD1YAG9_9MARC